MSQSREQEAGWKQGPAEPVPVSVVVPAFNRAEMVGRALRSVLAQTPRRPAEVIVVDDCSSDDTAAVAERWGAVVLRHEQNRGAAAARNTGLSAATQPWIALLDSDDEWLPHHLATLLGGAGEHGLISAAALGCGLDPRRDRYHGVVTRRPVILRSPAPLVFPDNFIPASAVLIRRDLVLEAGGYDTSWRYAEDFDLWLRMLDLATGRAIPEVVTIYHRHEDQKSQHLEGPQAAQRAIAESYADRDWWSRGLVERRLGARDWDNLRAEFSAGNRRVALGRSLKLAFRPGRVAGVLGIWARRFLIRRRSSQIARDGLASVALLPGAEAPTDVAELGSLRATVDLRAVGSTRVVGSLLRRPPGAAVAGAAWHPVFLRILGIRSLGASAAGDRYHAARSHLRARADEPPPAPTEATSSAS